MRTRLLDIQKDKERSENARRLREEKKFAHKAQAAALQQKQQNKKRLADAVKSHRKGMKAELQSMLSNAADLEDDEVGSRALTQPPLARPHRTGKEQDEQSAAQQEVRLRRAKEALKDEQQGEVSNYWLDRTCF